MSELAETSAYGRDDARIPAPRVAGLLRRALDRHRWQLLYLAALAALISIACGPAQLRFVGVGAVAGIAIPAFVIGILWQSAAAMAASAHGRTARSLTLLGRLGEGFATFAVWMGITASAAMISYLSARLPMPLLDARFVAWDAALGFHWPDWAATVAAVPHLPDILHVVYYSLIPQFLLVFLIAAVCGDRNRLAELFWSVAISATITCAVSGLVPALGAKPYFKVAGADWLADLTALRAPGPLVVTLSKMNGIVSLPSFHTELALIFAWATRRTGPVGWVIAGLNLVMVVSTLTVGGHYLVDVVAGVFAAVACIGAVHALVYRSTLPGLAAPH